MALRVLLFFVLFSLLFSFAFAVPDMPGSLSAKFHPNGIFVSWAHSGGEGVSFRVYRGDIGGKPAVVSETVEKSYLDSAVVPGKEYRYFITAVDSSGESAAASFTVTSPSVEERPFSIELVEPKKGSFGFGETVEFVVRLESARFAELSGLRAVLVNEALGTSREFAFDSGKRLFVLSEKLPEAGAGGSEAVSTKYSILVSASIGSEAYSESISMALALLPVKELDTWRLAWNILSLFGPAFLLLMVASTIAFGGWKWSLQRKAERDRVKLEILEIQRERNLWRYELFKRQVSEAQFREKESELQGKQAALGEKLGKRRAHIVSSANTFQGFSVEEAEDIMRIVKTMKKPEKGQTEDSLRARLVGLGKSERVAKKVAELLFEK